MPVRFRPVAPIKNIMNSRIQEILDILQEECAEVVQEVSKCRRFGINSRHPDGRLHSDHLEQEIGDVLFMIELLHEAGVVSEAGLQRAWQNKEEKLRKYSKIFE
jgi:NTP pyrophosphatase (non-canonical NTP hydrolase)